MVTRPFLSERTAAKIGELKRRGYATVRATQNPPVTITLTRRGNYETGGGSEHGPYDLIRIGLTNRDPRESGANRGAVETTTVGGFLAWAPIDAQQNDRFTWDEWTCVVESVQPRQNGVQGVQFHLLERTSTEGVG